MKYYVNCGIIKGMQKFAHKERKDTSMEKSYDNNNREVFLDNFIYTIAAAAQIHHNCMKSAYYNGEEIKKRFFVPGEHLSLHMMDFLGESVSCSTIYSDDFDNYRIFRYLPMELYDAITVGVSGREVIFFDIESGEALTCTVELVQANYGIRFDVRFNTGETRYLYKSDYGQKYVFLDPLTDRMKVE